MAITDVKARQAKAMARLYRIPDGGGLYLEVRPSGAKFWRYRYELRGKESMYTIGEYPDVTLSEARTQRDWARSQVKAGKSPTGVREIERKRAAVDAATTFRIVAEEWLEKSRHDWSIVYADQVESILEKDVYPVIGAMPISEITASDLLAMLQTIDGRGAPSIAMLARQRCSAIFCYAVSTLRAETDPTSALKGAIRRRSVRHHPHMEVPKLPKLIRAIDGYGGYLGTRTALRLLLLLFVRPGELRQAKWAEFDLDGTRLNLGGPLWEVPAERMKMRRSHLVPLSRQAVAMLEELQTLTGGREYLFPNLRDPRRCMSITTLNRVLERIGYGGQFSSHGFRATASTALHDRGYNSDHIEMQLAHADGSVRGSYNRALYLPERHAMMQDWADLIDILQHGESATQNVNSEV